MDREAAGAQISGRAEFLTGVQPLAIDFASHQLHPVFVIFQDFVAFHLSGDQRFGPIFDLVRLQIRLQFEIRENRGRSATPIGFGFVVNEIDDVFEEFVLRYDVGFYAYSAMFAMQWIANKYSLKSLTGR